MYATAVAGDRVKCIQDRRMDTRLQLRKDAASSRAEISASKILVSS